MSAPTRLTTFFNSRDMTCTIVGVRCFAGVTRLEGSRSAPCGAPRDAPRELLVLGPALDQLVIGDGLAFGLLVVELGPGRVILAQPLRGIALGVQPRSTAVIDVLRL